jgi:hypothetical protein
MQSRRAKFKKAYQRYFLAILAGWLGHRLEKIEGDLGNVIN